MLGNDRRINTTTHIEIGRQAHEVGLTDVHQRVEYAVGDVFVEGALVPERPDIQLQRFQFDTAPMRYVFQVEHGKIRLSCFRAQTGELGYADAYRVVTSGVRVLKRLEIFAGLGRHAGTIPEST